MGFLSLKRTMDEIGETRERAEASLTAYDKVLLALQSSAAAISGEEKPSFQESLAAIRSKLSPNALVATIEQSGEAVAKELDEFAQQRVYARDKTHWELKQVFKIVADAMATIAQKSSTQGEDLILLANRIGLASGLESLAEVREQLAIRVEEIKNVAERVQDEARAQTLALEGEVRKVKERLAVLEQLSETDHLTGLANRRMAENAIRPAIVSGRPLSILLFDLNGFKRINDTYGHQQGDQVLQLIAKELRNSVRETDVVCRWGGDEFVVLLKNSNLSVAEAKAAAIQRNTFGEFLFDFSGKQVRVDVSASVGVAEYRQGEDAFEFFERADRLMYKEKLRHAQHRGDAFLVAGVGVS